MRLFELFLNETTEEDRAIISLSMSIYRYIQKYLNDHSIIQAGKIGDIFDTPILPLQDVNIILMPEKELRSRLSKERDDIDIIQNPNDTKILGIWYSDKTLILNSDYISSNELKSAISHELRHALDDFKSDFRAGDSIRYSEPTKKEYLSYPSEVNARFLQVLHNMVYIIRRASVLDKSAMRPFVMRGFELMMKKYRISGLFPEKEQSKDYKRLIKRAMDFIEKELSYINSIPK